MSVLRSTPQTLIKTWPSEGGGTCPVGFVKAGLEHQEKAQSVCDFLDLASQLQDVLL